jgi:Family of unknown function (DUF6236)
MPMTGGIIVSSPIVDNPGGGRKLISPKLDDDLLRFWMLYWEEIVWPWCLGMDLYVDCSASDHWLTYGVVRQIHVPTSPLADPTPDFMARVIDRAWSHLEVAEPGRWAIAHRQGNRGFDRADLQDSGGLIVNLLQALPTPSENVPLDDILLFREKYRSELVELRDHINEVALDIVESPDRSLSETVRKRQLVKAVDAAYRAARSSLLEFKLVDINISFNIPAAFLAGVTAYYATERVTYALAASAVAGGISAKLGPVLKSRAHKGEPSPFQYAARVRSELIR